MALLPGHQMTSESRCAIGVQMQTPYPEARWFCNCLLQVAITGKVFEDLLPSPKQAELASVLCEIFTWSLVAGVLHRMGLHWRLQALRVKTVHLQQSTLFIGDHLNTLDRRNTFGHSQVRKCCPLSRSTLRSVLKFDSGWQNLSEKHIRVVQQLSYFSAVLT